MPRYDRNDRNDMSSSRNMSSAPSSSGISPVLVQTEWKELNGSLKVLILFKLNPEFWPRGTASAEVDLVFAANYEGEIPRNLISTPKGTFDPRRPLIWWSFCELSVDDFARAIEADLIGGRTNPGTVEVRWKVKARSGNRKGTMKFPPLVLVSPQRPVLEPRSAPSQRQAPTILMKATWTPTRHALFLTIDYKLDPSCSAKAFETSLYFDVHYDGVANRYQASDGCRTDSKFSLIYWHLERVTVFKHVRKLEATFYGDVRPDSVELTWLSPGGQIKSVRQVHSSFREAEKSVAQLELRRNNRLAAITKRKPVPGFPDLTWTDAAREATNDHDLGWALRMSQLEEDARMAKVRAANNADLSDYHFSDEEILDEDYPEDIEDPDLEMALRMSQQEENARLEEQEREASEKKRLADERKAKEMAEQKRLEDQRQAKEASEKKRLEDDRKAQEDAKKKLLNGQSKRASFANPFETPFDDPEPEPIKNPASPAEDLGFSWSNPTSKKAKSTGAPISSWGNSSSFSNKQVSSAFGDSSSSAWGTPSSVFDRQPQSSSTLVDFSKDEIPEEKTEAVKDDSPAVVAEEEPVVTKPMTAKQRKEAKKQADKLQREQEAAAKAAKEEEDARLAKEEEDARLAEEEKSKALQDHSPPPTVTEPEPDFTMPMNAKQRKEAKKKANKLQKEQEAAAKAVKEEEEERLDEDKRERLAKENENADEGFRTWGTMTKKGKGKVTIPLDVADQLVADGVETGGMDKDKVAIPLTIADQLAADATAKDKVAVPIEEAVTLAKEATADSWTVPNKKKKGKKGKH